MKITGLKEFQKKLDKLASNIKALDENNNVPLNEVLNDQFISKHTKFTSLSELIERSGFNVQSAEDFYAIPDDKWDEYIKSISRFSGWKEMLRNATELWAVKKLRI